MPQVDVSVLSVRTRIRSLHRQDSVIWITGKVAAANYVPYLGALAGVAAALVVGLLTFSTPGATLLPPLVYFALTTIEGQFVTPYFVGRRLEMNTVVIFLSITFWAWLWSVMGMLLAVPLLVTLRAFCEHIPRLEPVGKFLAARGDESEDVSQEQAGD